MAKFFIVPANIENSPPVLRFLIVCPSPFKSPVNFVLETAFHSIPFKSISSVSLKFPLVAVFNISILSLVISVYYIPFFSYLKVIY